MNSPDVEKLLRKPRIEKPQQEFEIPAPPEDTNPRAILPLAEVDPQSIVEGLQQEADRVQELLDLLIETAEDVEIPVDPELQPLLGAKVTTKDYLTALKGRSPRDRHVRSYFERNAIPGCGLNLIYPIFAAPDLAHMRDLLVSAANVVEGKIQQSSIDRTRPSWGEDAAKALYEPNYLLVQHAREYRGHVAKATFSLYRDMRSGIMSAYFEPALRSPLEELKGALEKLIPLLSTLRAALCHAQLAYLLQHKVMRQELVNALEEIAIQQVSNTLIVVVQQMTNAVTLPVLQFLRGEDGFKPLAFAGDAVSKEILDVVQEGSSWLIAHREKLVIDILRKLKKQRAARNARIAVLAQQAMIGRWIQHLDQAIFLCENLRNLSTSSLAYDRMREFLFKPLDAPASRTLKKLSEHPEYRHLVNLVS
jgi:hypothetical protein